MLNSGRGGNRLEYLQVYLTYPSTIFLRLLFEIKRDRYFIYDYYEVPTPWKEPLATLAPKAFWVIGNVAVISSEQNKFIHRSKILLIAVQDTRIMPEEKEKIIPVRVALRIRPLVPKETGDGCKECISCVPGHPQVIIGEDKAFTYDYVFQTFSKQADLYTKTVIPLLEGFFKGYNATVLAYGQTGSGKTYSMGTAFAMSTETNDDRGVIPRLIETVFDWIDERKDTTEFLLKASFLEV